jgi:nucleoside-diphosphate-sugar epimerase
MKIFVTGGTGFIGRALIKTLLEQGHQVRVLARRPQNLNNIRHPAFIPIQGDLSDVSLLRRTMDGCQQVYHLAALARAWSRHADEYDRSNIEGTRNILEASLQARVDRVVHTSTVMAIGPTDGFIADESTPIPILHLSHYQRTKAIAEQQVEKYVQKGLPVVTVAPSLVYGPGTSERHVSFNRLLHSFLTGKPVVIPGDGTQRFNCVYLEDSVNGHLLAMKSGRIGERYILGGENVSLHELVMLVNEISGTNRKLFHIPFGIAKIAGLIDETRARIIGGTPLLTWNSVEIYRHSWTYSSEKAVRELGYSPRMLREGIERTLRWLQSKDAL